MRSFGLGIILVGVVGSTASASGGRDCDFTALRKPISALSPPVSAIRGDPRVCATAQPPRFSVWRDIQPALDRSYGRIEDRATWELGRIERSRQPVREFEMLQEERDRRLRIEEQRRRSTQLDQMNERQQRLELDRREYEMFIRAPFSPTARQAAADVAALDAAKTRRDNALIAASNALTEALRQPGADRRQLQAEYQRARERIRGEYAATRLRILGD